MHDLAIIPFAINLFFHTVSLVKSDTFLWSALLALIILIPNAIANERTEKCHLYFSQREDSALIILSLFLGFGTHLRFGIDFRCNVFLIL